MCYESIIFTDCQVSVDKLFVDDHLNRSEQCPFLCLKFGLGDCCS